MKLADTQVLGQTARNLGTCAERLVGSSPTSITLQFIFSWYILSEEINMPYLKLKPIACASDVPKSHHYAIIVYDSKSVHHEGDERSRTNPGHGYPAYTETIPINSHYATVDKQLWEDSIEILAENKANFVAFEVVGVAQIKHKYEINVV